MAKTAAERKAEQRKRLKKSGLVNVELLLDQQGLEMLQRNCVLRRPERDPYDANEYLSMLIRIGDRLLKKEINKLETKCCNQLPITYTAITKLVSELNDRTWRRNWKPFYDQLVAKCYIEESIAEQAFSRVTK